MKLLPTIIMMACVFGLAFSWCKKPQNPCGFGKPCPDGFSVGCQKQYCWAQCNALNIKGEWCWVVSRASGNWLTCRTNEDCLDAADCTKAKCSGGCTIASKRRRFFRNIGVRVVQEDFSEMN